LAIGTDGAGSVRIPASFCGNVGLKPSFGRVPAYPLSPFGSVAHLGPHAMTVQDAALLMNTIALPDARDWTSLPFDGMDYLADSQRGVKGLRVAYSPTLGYANHIDPEIAAATAQAAQHLQDLGAVVEQVDPLSEDPLDITTGLWFAGAYQVWQSLSPAQQALTDPDFKAQAELGFKAGCQRHPCVEPTPWCLGLAFAPVHAALRPHPHTQHRGHRFQSTTRRPQPHDL
jgi:aspartyl-tRNA(Asn)/glutamyl-tRNA(Gln) amidotransferase subunit A